MSHLIVYFLSEAHPTEGGDYLDYFLPVSKHNSLQQRLDAAGQYFLSNHQQANI